MAEINKLAAAQVRSLDVPGRYADGLGLHLIVTKLRAKKWVFRYQLAGRRRDMGLGAFPDVSLADARDLRDAARELLRDGVDPIEARKAAREAMAQESAAPPAEDDQPVIPTFRHCAREVIKLKQPEWKNAKHGAQWAATLENYAFPVIGDLAVDEVTRDHVLRILKPIWLSKNETAGRVRGRIATILGWAKVNGYREGDNPAAWEDNLEFLLQKPSLIKHVQAQPALAYERVPALMAQLLALPTSPAAALAVIILTALRQSEVRHARAGEIDEKRMVWSVPPERIKRPFNDGPTPLPHWVPISSIEQRLMGRFPGAAGGYLFPGAIEGKPISEAAIRKLIKHYAEDFGHFTMHGFRSSFKDWAVEVSGIADADMISEAQLGHKLGSNVKVAYLRTKLIELRRGMMQAWCAYCLSEVAEDTLAARGLQRQDPAQPASA